MPLKHKNTKCHKKNDADFFSEFLWIGVFVADEIVIIKQ